MSFARGDHLALDIELSSPPSPVPAPTCLALALMGLLGVGVAALGRSAS
jgi:hypothetical protein